ncbi:hypothetical protein [Amycolatopsis sp. H20-H5]|uniref:hypothetical protein n=1 Tax=Amycolatopsis sp. H20-H5 TaxID=3046309 RepID=UPI002DB5F1E9|nr:hypothetical protein [Amycolatopsis sp. H20-H5]MEC3981679.1 hypothetical protein [Amycolatopsis sp. H20-H5]
MLFVVYVLGGLVEGFAVATTARRVAPEKLLGWGALGLLSVVQTAVAPVRAGRVLSTAFAATAAFTALGALLAGALDRVLGHAVLLDVQAGAHVLAGLVVLTGLVQPRRSATARARIALRWGSAASLRHQRSPHDSRGQCPDRRLRRP